MSDHTDPADRGLGEIAEHDRRLAAQAAHDAEEQARAAEAMEDSQRRLYERAGGMRISKQQ